VALSFDPAAADRWKTLNASTQPYERDVSAAVATVLRHLDQSPEQVGAIQFATKPTTWARIVDVNDGADWVIIWTGTDIRILRIEPAPSL
jgi:stage V sporulation protein SpoVS